MSHSARKKAVLLTKPLGPNNSASTPTPTLRASNPTSSPHARAPVYECDLILRLGPSNPSYPSSTSRPPVNALTAAFSTQQSVEARRQDALAKKRRREIETAPGYKDMASNLKKFAYSGPDPRDLGNGPSVEATPRKNVTNLPESRAEGEGSRSMRTVGNVERRSRDEGVTDNPRPLKQMRREVEKPEIADEDMCVEEDEEKDDMFDNILSKGAKGKPKTKYLTDPIKPFQSLKPDSTNPPSSSTRQEPGRPPYPVVKPYKTQNVKQNRNTQASSRYARGKPGQTHSEPFKVNDMGSRRPETIAQWRETVKRSQENDDEYGDADFDQLLASTTTFDDGTDMYADEGFDHALEQALAGGCVF